MKAIVCHASGSADVLKLEEIDKPAVSDDGVLVRVHASSLNIVDLFALTRPRMRGREVMGRDFAGSVESVGKDVTQFQPGDEVFGAGRGALAEFLCIPEKGMVVRKVANVTHEQAATLPVAATTALNAIRDHGHVQPGQKVLINGASGGVGTFAVQIAKSFGGEVTAICSTGNVDLVRSIGADKVIDYTQEDFTRGGQRYDVMIDVAGNRSWPECRRVLSPKARYVAVGAKKIGRLVASRLTSIGAGQKWSFFIARLTKQDLLVLQELVESGKVRPVIDRRYELGEAARAFGYLREGHAKGKIVIDVSTAS